MTDELISLMALSLIGEMGPLRMRRLIEVFGSPADVFSRSVDDLCSVEGIKRRIAVDIASFNSWKRIEKEIKRCESMGIDIVTYRDPAYPPLLREIDDSPLIFYKKGDTEEGDRLSVSIVGPRRPTEYGRQVAEKIASELSCSGMTVVSGMARGIDTVAHKAVLREGGRTIAVLGSGLDIPYPPENADLMKRIASCGAVISEYPLGTKPLRENFPRRNRLISGLSLGVLVVEATSDSGTLITAGYALEQGREVFAVPGMITSRRSSGTNSLIKQGARLVENANDIIEELAPQLKGYMRERKGRKVPLTSDEKIIADKLSSEPLHIDCLIRVCSLPAHRISGILTTLELKGVVRQMEGKRFYRIKEV